VFGITNLDPIDIPSETNEIDAQKLLQQNRGRGGSRSLCPGGALAMGKSKKGADSLSIREYDKKKLSHHSEAERDNEKRFDVRRPGRKKGEGRKVGISNQRGHVKGQFRRVRILKRKEPTRD